MQRATVFCEKSLPGEIRGIIAQYYCALRYVLRDKPHLRKCLTRCRHCRIFFLTHPRNAGRNDLRCPFGCRQAHGKESAKQRCTEYYRSREGKIKKKYLNECRSQRDPSEKSLEESNEEELPPRALETPLDNQIIIHIQTVTSLIEERVVPLNDILCMVNRILRQLSIGKGGKIVYAYKYPPGGPP